MRVTLLTSIADIGFSHNCGDVIEVDDAYSIRLIESGQAEAVDEPVVETATRKTATRKAAR